MKQRLRCMCIAVCILWVCIAPGYALNGSDIFQDVSPKSPFNEAIGWAVDKGITVGTTATTFSPSQICTRQHILTFLWRYAGKPYAGRSIAVFSDEPQNGDFKAAARWAYYIGLETGVRSEEGTLVFQGGTRCTRAAAVIYLWMLAGRPNADINNAHRFTDVHSGTTLDAVAWAMENGITNGTSATTFDPESTCTRGQIVTFLYRYSKIA